MGMAVVDSGIVIAKEVTGLSATSGVGAGIGGVFAVAALVYALAYLDLADAAEADYGHVKQVLVASIVPLFVVFLGIVLFEVFNIIVS